MLFFCCLLSSILDWVFSLGSFFLFYREWTKKIITLTFGSRCWRWDEERMKNKRDEKLVSTALRHHSSCQVHVNSSQDSNFFCRTLLIFSIMKKMRKKTAQKKQIIPEHVLIAAAQHIGRVWKNMNIIDPVDGIVGRRDVTNRCLLYADYCFQSGTSF